MKPSQPSTHYAYMLRCADGTIYSGYTTDPCRRTTVHNSGQGSKYTRSRLPVELVHIERYETKSEALKREAELKKLVRWKKIALIDPLTVQTMEVLWMNYHELDTPALLIDREILMNNLSFMQDYADRHHVKLCPHTKTHKMPYIAKLQIEKGASGIAVAKVGEAEVMAHNGISNIFIANEIVGQKKLERIRELAKTMKISFGVDTPCQVEEAQRIFAESPAPAEILIEIEVGENRSGIIEEADFIALLDTIRSSSHVHFRGIFSHDGNSYSAKDLDECREIAFTAQKRTVHFAELAEKHGMPCETVSYGSTPTLMNDVDILKGITEIRPGTYALMDASQGNAIGTTERCAATVLASVVSRPTADRVILDVGAKGLTMQERTEGICATPGKGTIVEYPGTYIDSVFDEHAIIYDRDFREAVQIGEKVRIIPVHICPVCNLYDTAYLISGDEVVMEIPVACRGKLT